MSYAGFQSVKLNKPTRSSFDLTHDKRLTTRMGRLTPVLVQECVPSDSFDISSEMLVRLAPLLAPIYDQIEVYVHLFFVPNRLIWEDWEEFITGGRLGVGIDPAVAPVPPFVNIGAALTSAGNNFDPGTLADYLGVPSLGVIDPVPANWNLTTLDVMPFGAYQLIWYHYYRDRNFIDDNDTFPLASGDQGVSLFNSLNTSQNRNYTHDYFTSALPFTQRGEEVLIPIEVALTYRDEAILYDTGVPGVAPSGALATIATGSTGPDGEAGTGIFTPGKNALGIDNIESASNGSTTINDFRAAYALQVWLERNAIGGSRYTESTQAHFGVKPQDSRLQRPEYIGGGRIPVRISEVLSTSWSVDGDSETVPLANMAGHGLTYGNTNRARYFCTEHGFIMGILSIMNPPSYFQGLPRMFRRRSFLDYPWPTFAKLGEQEVHNFEIYCNPASLIETDGQLPLFGYQSRYAEYKHNHNTVHGDFKTNLDFWHMARKLDPTSAVLNEQFIQCDPTNRVFAVEDETIDKIFVHMFHRINARRPLPRYNIPNL